MKLKCIKSVLHLAFVIVYHTSFSQNFREEAIFYYTFNHDLGNMVNDNGNLQIDGTAHNIEFIDGFYRNGAYFREVDSSRIILNNVIELEPEQFSIASWIRPYSRGTDSKRMEVIERTNVYWMNRRTGHEPSRIQEQGKLRVGLFALEEANKLDNDGFPDKGHWVYCDSKQIIPLHQWTHVAFTFGSDSLIIYINGKRDASVSNLNYVADGKDGGNKQIGKYLPYIAHQPTVNTVIGSKQNPKNDKNNDGKPIENTNNFVAQWDGFIDDLIMLPYVLQQNDFAQLMNGIENNIQHYQSTIKIYPNPASDHIVIDLGERNHVEMSIYNISGKVVLTQILMESTRLPITQITEGGLYIVELKDINNKTISLQKLRIN